MIHFPPVSASLLVVSPVIGSFMGVLAWRLPEGRSPWFTRSRCPVCNAVLSARELVPLVSYALQKGKCRQCAASIDPFHPIIEFGALAVAGSADLAVHAHGFVASPVSPILQGCVFGWVLLLLAALDFRSMTLPDTLTQPLLAVGLILAALQGKAVFHIHALTALLAWMIFAAIAMLYRWLRGRDGLGGGDAKLLAAGGGWLGPMLMPEIILFAALATLAGAALNALVRGQSLNASKRIPFGPGLALALWGGWLCQTAGWPFG
ncbi:potassium:proton antiporter [Asaia sp. W19]|uniref:prepilin peptidase n=1 Tax=unclassified Asaia TaxID=2685023 RepID=UPI000F8D6CDF|nr:A24 family peptidase [Asaia sp. W19]RUT26398.1 potassium:proton antiporter [Asaia sp. W19]